MPLSTPPSKLLCGLIGSGIQLSLTPAMHEEEARHHGLRMHYQLIDLDVTGSSMEQLPTLVQAARMMGFAGLNITYPCKQAVIPLLDDLSDEARAMGAVNTIVFQNGKLTGHNTDGSGWTWGFRNAHPDADVTRVVLLGAGGAGSAIAHALLRLGAQSLVVVDSDAHRATALADNLNAIYSGNRASAGTDTASALHNATGLVHATPTGTAAHPGMPVPAELLHPGLWVADVVYFPIETQLIQTARARGCPVIDGGTMAVGQAIGAFELFTGQTADVDRLRAHFMQLLAQRGV
jgi:shikimate dehydrogenase